MTQSNVDPRSAAFTARAMERFPTLSTLCEALRVGELHALAEELGLDPSLMGAGIELPTYGGQALTRDEIRRHFAWSWDATHLLVGESPDDVKIVPRS